MQGYRRRRQSFSWLSKGRVNLGKVDALCRQQVAGRGICGRAGKGKGSDGTELV